MNKARSLTRKALIVAGTGRYSDPWHPFEEICDAVGTILEETGFEVTRSDDVDASVERLGEYSLFVVAAGDPWRNSSGTPPTQVARDALRTSLDDGIGVLAMHSAASSLRDYPEWGAALGAVWLPTVSYHPPFGEFSVHGAQLPDGSRIGDFEVEDEQYRRLQFIGESDIVAWHSGEEAHEPAAWVRQYSSSRIAVNLLGHDARSFDSAGHRALIKKLADWATSAT